MRFLPALNHVRNRLRESPLPVAARLGLFAVALAGCAPTIGDKCVVSTDCSTRGDRLCDTSQPGGYCTVFNCEGDGCPDKAACVLFNASVPGCGYDDRSGGRGSRVARTFCVATCQSDSDCRDGYVCADPRQPPWNALIKDDDQSSHTCLVAPDGYSPNATYDASVPWAPVCSPTAPDVPPIDASAPSIFDGSVAQPDVDAGDAGDAGDASDAGP